MDEMAMAFFDAAERPTTPSPQVHSFDDLDAPVALPQEPPSPEQIRRQVALRKVVSAVMGMAAVLAIAVGFKSAAARGREVPMEAFTSAAMMHNASQQQPAAEVSRPATIAQKEEKPAPEPVRVAPPAPEPAKVEAPAAKVEVAPGPAKAEAAPEPAKAEVAPEPAKAGAPAEPAKAEVDPAAAKELSKKALRALESGKYKDSIELAQQAIAADPSDANNYMYWGTALMETGKRKEAKEVFARCVEAATRGPRHECRQFR